MTNTKLVSTFYVLKNGKKVPLRTLDGDVSEPVPFAYWVSLHKLLELHQFMVEVTEVPRLTVINGGVGGDS